MKSGWLLLGLAVVACGKVEEPLRDGAPVNDGEISGDAPVADAPPPRCDPSKAFAAPTPVAELNSTASDTAPWLTPDELTVYFASSRSGGAGGMDLYFSTRADRQSPWAAPQPLSNINTSGSESRPTLTADGLTLYAELDVPGDNNGRQIASATRASLTAAFSTLQIINVLSSPTLDSSPTILPDHSGMYLVSARNNTQNRGQLFRSTRQNNSFTTPQLVAGTMLDVGDNHEYMTITPDELTLYFSSDRTGGAGGFDVWVATRTSLVGGFGTPTPVAELNGGSSDMPFWVSPDNCELYMTKVVGTTAAFLRIYVAKKPL